MYSGILLFVFLFYLCANKLVHRMVANVLDATFSKGDAIAIDMPMTVHAVIIYLAIVLAGFVVVSIADSFAAKEIATRLRVSKAKGIFTQVNFYFYRHHHMHQLVMKDHQKRNQLVHKCLFFLPHHAFS